MFLIVHVILDIHNYVGIIIPGGSVCVLDV
jgi:hypothetical protein